MTRKYMAGFLAALLGLSLAGCAAPEESAESPAAGSSVQSRTADPQETAASAASNALDAADVREEDASAAAEPSPQLVRPEEVGIRPEQSEDYTEGVLRSSAVHVRDGSLYLAYKDQLASGPVAEGGGLDEAEVLMEIMPTIASLAGDEDTLYLATNDGIFALPADALSGAELTSGRLLTELDIATNPFYIWSDWLFFLFDGTVYVVPKAGGSEAILAEDVSDFQVTNRGLFCTSADGALTFLSFADGESETLIQDGCSGRITFLGDTAYMTTGRAEPVIRAFNAEERQPLEIELRHILSATHGVWTEPGRLICQTEDGQVLLYDIGAGSETRLGRFNMPYYEAGELADSVLYNMSGDKLSWMHLTDGTVQEAMLPELLAADAEQSAQ
ncbi:MAG: hypothetical protein HDQ87_01565 [Clostridia bacterium]|nr:hypothetical protein [Clostridia bacterium]